MDELSDIKRKLGEISELLRNIENKLSLTKAPAAKLESDMLQMVRRLIDLYYMMVDYMDRGRRIQSLVGGDDIKVWIIRTLYKYGEMNIFSLTEAIKMERGRISRGTVAKKLKELEEAGIVKMTRRGREKIYSLHT